MLFNVFKKKSIDASIASQLTNILSQNPNNLHIMIYLKDQILFQLMPAYNFRNRKLLYNHPNDFVLLHFFHKNKTLTFDKLNKLQEEQAKNNEYFYYEEPKGIHNFLKVIGRKPIEIEQEIYANFKEIYELSDLRDITIEYEDY